MGSTDQADPSCFYFSGMMLFLFFHPLGFLQGLKSSYGLLYFLNSDALENPEGTRQIKKVVSSIS